jgi:hypothetical protein
MRAVIPSAAARRCRALPGVQDDGCHGYRRRSAAAVIDERLGQRQAPPTPTSPLWTGVYGSVYSGMAATKMLRVSERTHDGFRREAQRRGVTIDEVAAAALRALRQVEMGEQLATQLESDEAEWLDAPLR